MKTKTKVIRNWLGYQRKLERKQKSQVGSEDNTPTNQCLSNQNVTSKPMQFNNFGYPHFIQQVYPQNMNILGIGYLLIPKNSFMLPRNLNENRFNFY